MVVIILIAGALFGLLVSFGYRLAPLLFSKNHVALNFSPNDLQDGEVVIAILAMMFKSMIPNWISAWIMRPALKLSSPFIMNEEHLARYQIAIGKRDEERKDVDPLHQLLFLSAVTEPAMLLLLASPACPVNPLGAVNVRNRFELLRPDLCVPTAFKTIGQAQIAARILNDPRPVKRGVEFDLEVALSIRDQTNIGGTFPVFRQIFTMLEFRKTKTEAIREHETSKDSATEPGGGTEPVIEMSFQDNDTLKWAKLCKDYNFIHLSRAAAKAFGLPGKLIHGNHAIARALQHIPTRSLGNSPSWMEVHFRKPMVTPGVFEVAVAVPKSENHGFTILRANKTHAVAEYGALIRKRW